MVNECYNNNEIRRLVLLEKEIEFWSDSFCHSSHLLKIISVCLSFVNKFVFYSSRNIVTRFWHTKSFTSFVYSSFMKQIVSKNFCSKITNTELNTTLISLTIKYLRVRGIVFKNNLLKSHAYSIEFVPR